MLQLPGVDAPPPVAMMVRCSFPSLIGARTGVERPPRQRALTLRFDGAGFHGDVGSLLPGLLAVTGTGLAPARRHEPMHGFPLSTTSSLLNRRPCHWAQHRYRECPAQGSNLRTMPTSPALGRASITRVASTFVGFLWDLLLEPTSAGVSLVDESTFYLQLRVVGGAGFEPATPAL
jgi:hypothetical protein